MAIAKNEARYISEWLAYHLAIGVDRIIVHDNDSTDGTGDILRALSASFPVEVIDWPGAGRRHPQREAYNAALARISADDWVAFIDIDEFIVPWGFENIHAYLATVPDSVGCIALNWRIFGSAGRSDADYGLVTRAFTRASSPAHGYQRHFKSLARASHIQTVFIHHVDLMAGDLVYSNFCPLEPMSTGAAPRPLFAGIQLNHYQCKTRAEFEARMAKGHADRPPGPSSAAARLRDLDIRFSKLDRNEVEDRRIERFLPAMESMLRRFSQNAVTQRGSTDHPPSSHAEGTAAALEP